MSDFQEAETKLCLEIYEWINDNLNNRQADTNVNRASSAPGCVRKRWYQANGYQGEVMQPRSFITFGFGDLTEHWMKALVEMACVGPGKMYSEVDFGEVVGTFKVQHREFKDYKQEDLEFQIPGGPKIVSHPDGWGKRNSDGEWELIEIKSSSSYGFDDFKRGETPDYIRQVHALMLSDKAKKLGVKSARFLYMNKNTSHVVDRLYDFDQAIADQVVKEFIQAAGPDIPDRPYAPIEETYYKKATGRKVLPYPCNYCPFHKVCHEGVEVEISKSGKPVFVVKGSH